MDLLLLSEECEKRQATEISYQIWSQAIDDIYASIYYDICSRKDNTADLSTLEQILNSTECIHEYSS